MRRISFLICILFAIAVFFSSCSSVKVGDPQNFSFKGFQNNRVQFSIMIPVENSRKADLKITNIDLEARLDEKYLGKITNPDTLKIPGKSNQLHQLNLELELKNMLLGATTLMQFKSNTTPKLGLNGTIIVRSGCIKKKVHIDQNNITTNIP